MVKRGGPMLGEGKTKLEKKPEKQARKKDAANVLANARRLRKAGERAAYLEAALDTVDKPAKLVDALVDALFDSDLSSDECAEKLVAISRARKTEAALLDAIGRELDNRYCEDESIEVLRLAVAAGTKNKRGLETLGRLLVARGDIAGVTFLERAIERDPDWDAPRVALAGYLVDKEPERALAILGALDTGYAHDLRAMVHESAGRTKEANLSLSEALSSFDNDLDGRNSLAGWHYQENRFDRALVHAKVLFQARREGSRRMADMDLDDVDERIAEAYRVGGEFKEIVPWLVERCKDDLPGDLAWHVFYGLTAYRPVLEPELALRAAEVQMKYMLEKSDPGEARLWRVRIAGLRATLGDVTALEALARDGLENDSGAWVELASEYCDVDLYAAATACVDRALQLDPDSSGAISVQFDLALAAGDVEMLHRVSEALVKAEPLWHQGPEHLGRALARRGDAPAALTAAKRAVQIAPYCHNAWIGLAEAHLVAGHLVKARTAAERAAAIDAPELGDDVSILLAALAGKPDELEQALAARYKHLAALPFPEFIERLRATARASTE